MATDNNAPTTLNTASHGRSLATVPALLVFIVTSGIVSWLTPDGNLLVTVVPALITGGITFAAFTWWQRRKHSR